MPDELLLLNAPLAIEVTPNGRTSVDLMYKSGVQVTPAKGSTPAIEFLTSGRLSLGYSQPMVFSYCDYVTSKGYAVYRISEDGGMQFYGYGGYDDGASGDGLVAMSSAVDTLNEDIDQARTDALLALGGLDPNAIDITQDPGYPSNTAVTFEEGALFSRSAAGIASGGVVGDFTFGAWVRIDAYLEQYTTFFSLHKTSNHGETNSYFWFGHDSQAGGGYRNRGIAVFGPNGSHSMQTLPALGTWMHVAVTKSGSTCHTYLDGVLDSHDGGTGSDINIGVSSYDEIDVVYLANEAGWSSPGWNGAMRAAFLTTSVLNVTQIQTAMTKSSPLNAGGGSVGSWPLTGPGNLADALGGTGWTVDFGTLSTSTGPSAIAS